MSYSNKQVADMRPGKGITAAESDEHQRRWSEQRWERAKEEGNYDPTRSHLNFEVTKGGIVRPIDTSKTIPQRYAERLAELGLKDPNAGLDTPKYRTLAKFIFGGSRERMHELAFGGRDVVDLSKGADNSHVTRQQAIEDWARDVYRYVAEKYGEDNILGFYCHLDEMNPHIHCTLLPLTPEGKISYKKVFHGDSITSYRENTAKIHDELAAINARYGLTRGTSTKVTGAKHMSSEEYRRRLAEECHTLEEQIRNSRLILRSLDEDLKRGKKKVKGLSTMIENLKKEKAALELQLSDLKHQAMTGGMDAEDAQQQIEELERKIAEKDEKLAEKMEKLDKAEQELEDLEQELVEGNEKQEKLLEMRRAVTSDMKEQAELRMSHAVLPDLLEDFHALLPHLSASALTHMEGSLLNDLMADGDSIFQKAVMLFIGYVDQSTMVAEGGGGGTSSNLPWGRDDDEDDRAWARRCMKMARSIVRRSGGGPKR